MATIPSLTEQYRFPGQPNFKPHFSPREMLELGVYGGGYFYWLSHRKFINPELFVGLPNSKFGVVSPNQANNYFGVPTMQRARPFVDAIVKNESPKGWFQWYCKFWYGTAKDFTIESRIVEWTQDVKNLWSYLKASPDDLEYRKDIRQALLEMGWDSTKDPSVWL